MHSHGVEVERPIVPISIELATSETELKGPNAHPVKVRDGKQASSFIEVAPR